MNKTRKILVTLLFVFALLSILSTKSEARTQYDNVTFDAEYYASTYSDLRSAFGNDYLSLYNHYMSFGIREGRSGSPLFDVRYYTENNSDLNSVFKKDYQASYNHFLTFGIHENRVTSPYFNAKYYLENNQDLMNAFGYNYEMAFNHFFEYGLNEGRKASLLFDIDYYLNSNKDLLEAFGYNKSVAYNHYWSFGQFEGRSISPYFDPKYYLDKYSDMKKKFGKNYTEALKYFSVKGLAEGRRGSKFFDVSYYLNTYPDLKKAFGNDTRSALAHYQNCGINEGRNPSEDINIHCYLNSYTDLKNAFGNQPNYRAVTEHLYTLGLKEGRKTNHTIVTVNKKDATCEENGNTEGKSCSTCKEVIKKSETIKALGHSWEKATFEWNETHESATATRVCSRCKKSETVDCKVSSQIIVPVTCEQDGQKMYTAIATFSDNSKENSNYSEDIKQLGHIWNEPTISWDDDYNVKVTFTCQNDKDGKCSQDCTVVLTKADAVKLKQPDYIEVKEEPWASDNDHPNTKDTTKYTVKGSFGGHSFEGEEIKPAEEKVHEWKVTKVEWTKPDDENDLGVKATLTCTNGNHDNVTITNATPSDSGEETKPAKCEETGTRTYKNFTIDYDGKQYTYSAPTDGNPLTKTIKALGHNWTTNQAQFTVNWTNITENDATVTVTRPCLRPECNETESGILVSKEIKNKVDVTCDKEGSGEWEAIVKFPTSVNTTYKLEQKGKYTTSALGHEWPETLTEENSTCNWTGIGAESNDENVQLSVTIKCNRDNKHIKTITVTKDSSDNGQIEITTNPATCKDQGSKTYKATIKFSDGSIQKEYTVEKKFDLPKLETHSEYTWEEVDGGEADGILQRKCSVCETIDYTQARVTNAAGLKKALEDSKNYQTIELIEDISGCEQITVNKTVTIKNKDGVQHTITGTGESIIKASPTANITFDNIKLSGGTKGAVKAQNGAQVSAINGTSYENENYDVPFVYTDNRSSNLKVSASGKTINGVIPQKLKVWDGDKDNAYGSALSVGDTLENDDSNNDKYYFINNEFNSKFAKITYTSERSVIGGFQVSFVRYYDLKENAGTKDKIEPPDGLKYITTYTTGIATYSVESYVSFANLTPHNPGTVPAPTSSLIDYLYSIKLVGNVSSNVEVVNNKQALETAVDTGDKNIVVINGEIDLEGGTLEIKKEGVTILGHVKNGEYSNGSIKGKVKVTANNVIFESLTINGYSSSDVSSEAIVTVSGSGFKSNSSTYKSDASVSGDWQEIIHFTADKPTATLFYNVFNGDKAKALMKFDKIDQEIIKSATEIETSGTRIIGNDLVSGSATEKQIIISDFSDIGSVAEGKQARLYIALNEVDIVNKEDSIGLDVKAKDGVTVQIGSVYFVRHYEGEPASKEKLDEVKNAKQKFIININNSDNATNFKINLSSTQNLPKGTKWSSTCSEHPEGVKIIQEGVTYNGNGNSK